MKFFKRLLHKPLSLIINYVLKCFNIFIIFRIGNAIGDQLCMSAVIRLIDEQYPFRIIVISSFPELFDNNPRVWKCFGIKGRGLYQSRILRFFSGAQLENFLFKSKDFLYEKYMHQYGSNLHLVQAHSLHFKHQIDFKEILNEIYFSKNEISKYSKKFELPKIYCVVQPNSKLSYTPNKQWEINNFQYVINKKQNIEWIQLGMKDEFLLENVSDFRGKTSLREFFYIISQAKFTFANEGLINHVSSAFGIKSYVVSSGFSDIALSNYKNTIFFDSHNSCEYSPCWQLQDCGILNKPCLSSINPDDVIQKLL
jgi:ADP-heptose:LPS heptosyltransferase